VVTRSVDKLLLVNPDTFEILDRADTGGEPWGIAVNESTNRVYVGNYASDDVWVYDADTLDVLAQLPVGFLPGASDDHPGLMAILPGQDTVFVLLKGPSRVAIIEGLTVKGTVETGGSGPFGIAVDPFNQQVYISNGDTPSLTYLTNQNGAWQPQFGAGFLDKRRLFDVAYNPSLQKLYVVNADAQGNWFLEYWKPDPVQWGFIGRQALPSGGDLASADVGGAGLEVDLATGNVFNANTGATNLTVLDGSSDGMLATIDLGSDPFPVAIDQTRKIVYIGLRAPGRVVKLNDAY
jgi:YVTN family beta-propeller protein